MKARTLPALVGQQVRKVREQAGRSQDELAGAARRAGLDWTRAAVASLETGRRGLSAEELILLPTALSILTGQDYRLGDLLPDAWIETPTGSSVHARSLRGLLAGESVAEANLIPPWGRRVKGARLSDLEIQGEAVRHVAAVLNVSPKEIAATARRLWRHELTEERERRVVDRAGEGASPQTLRALRGHVTRELLDELRQTMRKE